MWSLRWVVACKARRTVGGAACPPCCAAGEGMDAAVLAELALLVGRCCQLRQVRVGLLAAQHPLGVE